MIAVAVSKKGWRRGKWFGGRDDFRIVFENRVIVLSPRGPPTEDHDGEGYSYPDGNRIWEVSG